MAVKYPFMHRENTVQIKRNTLYFSVLRLYFIEKTAKKVVLRYFLVFSEVVLVCSFSALCLLSTLSGFYSNRMTPTTSAMACIWLRWSVNGGYFSLSDTQVMCSSSLARCTRLMSAPCSVLRT